MGRDIFGEDEGEFRDMPDEAMLDENGNLGVSPPAQIQLTDSQRLALQERRNQIAKQQQMVREMAAAEAQSHATVIADPEELLANADEEDDFSAVLSDARIRLEMGRLYDMVMNHDLFAGVESDPRAIKSVQKQIRRFAKEQMEVMLGMRRVTTAAPDLGIPFNGLEVQVLKKIAATFSKGATETEAAESVPVNLEPKKQTLNSIGPVKQSTPAPMVASPSKPLPARAATPVKREVKQELPPEMEPDYKPLTKSVHEMSAEELIERNRQASARQKGKRPAKAPPTMPMPSTEQQEMLYTERLLTDSSTSGTVATIMNLMRNQKKQ